MIWAGMQFVCDDHGPRVDAEKLVEQVDGVLVGPGHVVCSECGGQLILRPKEE